MPSKKSSKPAPTTKRSVQGQVPPKINSRDTFRVGNVWMIQLHDGKHVRVPMLHEEFPGGKEVSQRLLFASSRARELIQEAKRKPSMSPHDLLGIETERAHFRFNQIIKESRVLKDKGLLEKSRNNLVHARKLLDDINDQREKLGLAPLSPKEFMSFQRPLTPAESIQLLMKANTKNDKRKTRRRMVRALRAPEEKVIQLLHARVEQLEKGNVKIRLANQREITQLLALPSAKLLRVMSERVKQLIVNEKAAREITVHLGRPSKTINERLAELPGRFAKLSLSQRKDALTLLQIARKGLELERVLRKKGKMAQAAAALKIYEDAFRTFGELLPE